MRYICHYKIPDSVPDTGTIDYESLAKTCAVDPTQLKQHLRFAIANRIFCEPSPNHVAHTTTSLVLKEGCPMQASVQWLTEDCAPMIAHQLDALEKWGPGSQEPNETAVTYAYGGKDFYDFIQSDPVRERRFGTTITQVAQQPRSSLKFIQSGFDWDSLGTATVVDVGGHTGSCAVAIAEAAPKLHVIVQDRPDVVAMAQEPKTNVVPAELQGRVSFQAHDFYTPQPTPADVYFFRKTLLNHTDRWAGKVIQALSPVLKEGNRLLIMDFVQSDGPVQTTPIERFTRAVDLQMLLYYNSRYRTLDEWKALVAATEPRLEFETVCTPPGSGLAIISFIVRSDSMANGSLDNGSVNNGSSASGSLANRDSEAKESLDNASLENGGSTVNGSSTVNGASTVNGSSTDNKDSMANGSSTDNKDPMDPGSLMENGSSFANGSSKANESSKAIESTMANGSSTDDKTSMENGSSVANGSSMDNGSSMPNGSPKANESSKAVESPMANGTSTDEKTSMDNGSPLADGGSMDHGNSVATGGLANGHPEASGSSQPTESSATDGPSMAHASSSTNGGLANGSSVDSGSS